MDPALSAPDAPIWWAAHAGGDVLDARSNRCPLEHKADLALSRARSIRHVVIGPNGVENVLVRTSCSALTLRLVGARAYRNPVDLTYLVSAKLAKSESCLLGKAQDMIRAPGRLVVHSRRRIMMRNALIALDGKLAGATYFEIAVVIFGDARARQAWRSTSRSLKDQIRRAWLLGQRLRDGAYRELLRRRVSFLTTPVRHSPSSRPSPMLLRPHPGRRHTMSKLPRSKFLTTTEAAEYLRLVPHTLENMRWQGTGPEFRKHGGRIFYHLDEIKRWSADSRRQSSSGLKR